MKKIFIVSVILSIVLSQASAQGIFMEGKTFAVDTLLYRKQAGPGVYHSSYRLPSYPLDFEVIEVDLTNPYNEIETVKALDRAVATERPTNMAIRKNSPGHEVVGGTNGDFYFYQDAPEIGIPRSGQFLDGEIIANPTGRASFIMGMNKKPYVDRINFRSDLISGTTKMRIHTVNMLRLEWEPNATNFLTLYTDKFGTTTSAITGGTKVVIRPKIGDRLIFTSNDTIECIVESVAANTGTSSIPAGKAVLHGRDAASTFLQGLTPGSEVKIAMSTLLRSTPDALKEFKEQVGGSDCIVLKNGVPQDEAKTAASGRNPRTGMGFSQDSTKVFMVVVDGRTTRSIGVDLLPFGELFKGVGAWNAVNLDGGGSSVMFVNGEVKNVPSDGAVRAVGNGVQVVSNAPQDNEIVMIKALYDKISLPQYGYYNPVILGYNKYGALLNSDLKDVTLSTVSGVGEILNDSIFFASGADNGILRATYNGATTDITVTKITDAVVKMRLDSVLLDNVVEYPIEVEAVIGKNSMQLLPSALTWEVSNPAVCQISNGVLKGISNGRSLVIGTLGSFKDTLVVNIEISPTPVRIAKTFNAEDKWNIVNSSNLTNMSHTPAGNGLTSTFTYAAGRNTNISYNNTFEFYSLPDTFKLKFNPGSINFSKIVMRFKENNSGITSINKEYNGFQLNKDNILAIPLDKVMNNPNDRGAYPVQFNFMQFLIDPTGMVAGQQYTLEIKELTLVYNQVNTAVDRLAFDSGIRIFPNPLKNDIQINFEENSEKPDEIKLYHISGQLVKSWKLNPGTADSLILPVSEVRSGAYLLEFSKNKRQIGSFKVVKQ